MSKQCYKIVLNKHGKLTSARALGKAEVTYVPNQPTVPPEFLKANGYGLAVFTSLEHALEFLSLTERRGELWECTCTEITDNLPLPLNLQALALGWFHPGHGDPWTKGTKMAPEVALTRKVGVATTVFFVPVTPYGQEWQGVGRNEGLIFDPIPKFVTFGSRLVFGYLKRSKATQVSPFVLGAQGYSVLPKTTGSVVLTEGEVAAREAMFVKLHRP